MKPNVNFIIALILFIFAGSLIIVGPVHSAWYIETSPTNVTLNDVFVVGNGGMIMRDFINKPPFPPPVDGPVDEANFGELDTIVLDGGGYSDPENHLHDLTYFQVRRADSRELRLDEIDGVLIDRETVQNLADDNLYIDRQLWRWENGHYHSDSPDTDPNLAMEAYAGYWVKARQANVFLRFEPGARVASLGKSEILLAGIWKKTKTWLSNLNIFSHEAVAENDDTPPMPMGALDDNTVDSVFQGCFIEITKYCN